MCHASTDGVVDNGLSSRAQYLVSTDVVVYSGLRSEAQCFVIIDGDNIAYSTNL